MKNWNLIPFLFLSLISHSITAQQMLWFGEVELNDKTSQGRFEVFRESKIERIIYAPYGRTPVAFQNVKDQDNQLSFSWLVGFKKYECQLIKKDSAWYEGACTCTGQLPMQIIMRQFTPADAILQGDSLHASTTDIRIIDRALTLLNIGKNWNQNDNRICDDKANSWSLFCALYQASIDVDSEYKHLRPAIQCARQAINEFTSEKKYAHLLQDFNNETKDFGSIRQVLERAKEILTDRIESRR